MLAKLTAGKRFYATLALLVAGGWVWLLFAGTWAAGSDITVCWFKNITGVPCPSCGTTTSVGHILHGRFAAAMQENLLGYVALTGLLLIPVLLIADLVNKKNLAYRFFCAFERETKQRPVILVVIFLMLALNWIWLLINCL